MNDRTPNPFIAQQLRALQITVGTLAAGSMAFAVIAIVVHSQGVQIAIAAFPLLSIIAVVQAVALVSVRPLVLSAMLRSARQNLGDGDPASDEQWMRIFSSMTITGAALLEGAAFMFFIAYMLEGEWWTLAGGVAMVALIVGWHFPTEAKATAWIEQQR